MRSECPHCGNEFEVFDRLAGRRVKCPRCGERFRARPAEAGATVRGSPERAAQAARSARRGGPRGHFLTRDVGVIIFGVVAVGAILGALAWRMYVDHQRRVAQQATREEALAAKDAGDQFLQRSEYAKARERYLEAQQRLEELEVPDRRLRRALDTVLKTDEIEYLGRGMVHFRGSWMTKEEKEAKVAKDQGLVEFEGRWVTPEEKTRLEAEKEEAEQAAQLAQEEAVLSREAEERGLEVVTAFFRYAHDKAPDEAAERYMSALTGDPLGYPRIVFDFRIDDEVAYVSQDAQRKHPDVSATYCGVKVYVTTATPVGQERVVWNFQVRKVASEWKITYAKQKPAPQLAPAPKAAAAEAPGPAEAP